jgi:hypothetical protein
MTMLSIYIGLIVVVGGSAFGVCWAGAKLDDMLHGDH